MTDTELTILVSERDRNRREMQDRAMRWDEEERMRAQQEKGKES